MRVTEYKGVPMMSQNVKDLEVAQTASISKKSIKNAPGFKSWVVLLVFFLLRIAMNW